MIVIDVLGTPAPKGSSRAILINGRAQIVPNSSTTNAREQAHWVKAIRNTVLEVLGPCLTPRFSDTPLVVDVTFRLERPGGHWGKGRNAERLVPSAPPMPTVKPDLDKILRCTIDALTGLVYDDDSRIVRLLSTKQYAAKGNEGARIRVGAWTADHETLRGMREQLALPADWREGRPSAMSQECAIVDEG